MDRVIVMVDYTAELPEIQRALEHELRHVKRLQAEGKEQRDDD